MKYILYEKNIRSIKPEGALDTAKQKDIEDEATKYKPNKQSIYLL